jgi:hypothetical protein
MQNKFFRKGLVVGVILLFLCLVYTPIINAETKNSLNMNTIKSIPNSLPSYYIFIAFGNFYLENETVKGHYNIWFEFYYWPKMMHKIERDIDWAQGDGQSIYMYSKHVIIRTGIYGW